MNNKDLGATEQARQPAGGATPLSHANVSQPIGAHQAHMVAKRRYLLLASYCGDDDPDCSDHRPCSHCLAMCNVFRLQDGEMLYDRELGEVVGEPLVKVIRRQALDARSGEMRSSSIGEADDIAVRVSGCPITPCIPRSNHEQ